MTSRPIRINPMPAFVRECTEANARRCARGGTLKPRPLGPMPQVRRIAAYVGDMAGRGLWSPTPRQRRRMAKATNQAKRSAVAS